MLASGISICGVSAAIATAGAIRARPILPIAVSMLIVVFAMLELVVLPAYYAGVAADQPIVNGAAMGMTVKTDGADAAAGGHPRRNDGGQTLPQHRRIVGIGLDPECCHPDQVWIDVFIGVWAFGLALIWVYKVERKPGEARVGPSEIWFRFPKFVIGYFIAWLFYVGIAVWFPDAIKAASAGPR